MDASKKLDARNLPRISTPFVRPASTNSVHPDQFGRGALNRVRQFFTRSEPPMTAAQKEAVERWAARREAEEWAPEHVIFGSTPMPTSYLQMGVPRNPAPVAVQQAPVIGDNRITYF